MTIRFVQFPHPGPEHNPGNAPRMRWNTDGHKRKFMRNPGRFVSGDGVVSEGMLTFWGEWEAPSDIVETWPESGSLPRFLQAPIWQLSAPDRRQNSDPWVFGDYFRYSNCKQQSQPALQRLTPGSVILFGSGKSGQFVIDTVFVVKDSCPYTRRKPPATDDAFRFCVIESLCGPQSSAADDSFTLYRGATLNEPIDGMYSFAPSRRADSRNRRFARPPIELPGYVNPESQQTPSGANKPRSPKEVHDQWDNVSNQVLDADCLLGVWFQTPALARENERMEANGEGP
ncbi:MAG: hypothetical protein ACLPNY_08825 [Roseiarcus sp.]